MRYKKGSLATGFPTIINILLLLFFACVSMLSLSHARADQMIAQRTSELSAAYFEADRQGQLLLGQFTEYAALLPDDAGREMETMLNEQGIAALYDVEQQIISFTLPAGQAGNLSIQLHLIGMGQYEIVTWKLIPQETEEILF